MLVIRLAVVVSVWLLCPAPCLAQGTPVAEFGVLKGLTIERVVGLEGAERGDGSAQVRCGVRIDGPDGDDQRFPPPDVDEDSWFGETELDCALIRIADNDELDTRPQFDEGLHEADAVLHFKTDGTPNTEDFPCRRGTGCYEIQNAQAFGDDDPVPRNIGSVFCRGPNATCAVGAPVFVMGGSVQRDYLKADAEVRRVPDGGGRGPSAAPPISVASFASVYFTPESFQLVASGAEVVVSPRFEATAMEVIHATASIDVAPASPPSAPAALLSARSASINGLGAALLAEQVEQAAARAPAFLRYEPGAAAELTIAGAALAFGSLAVDRYGGGGAERPALDVLAEYFASPAAVSVVAPEQAQPGYVPTVTHREVAVGGTPVTGSGLDPSLRDLVPEPVLEGIRASGERVHAPTALVGLVIGVEGTLLDAVNVSVGTPGTALQALFAGLANGEIFTIDVGIATSSFGIAEARRTAGALIDDFGTGSFSQFLDVPGLAFAIEAGPGILGEQREVAAELLETSGEGFFVSTTSGAYSHDQATGAFAVSDLTYDGPDASEVDPGEGSLNLDLTADGANAFVVGIDRLENFSEEPLQLAIGARAVVDDPARTPYEFLVPFDEPLVQDLDLPIPFHLLDAPEGALEDVAALELVVDGSFGSDHVARLVSFETARVETWPPVVDAFDAGALSVTCSAVGSDFVAEPIPLVPGGQREGVFEIVATEGVSNLSAFVADGALVYRQGPQVFGNGSIRWDGLDTSPALGTLPLPGVDLGRTGASAFEVNVRSLRFDGPMLGGVEIGLFARRPGPVGPLFEATLMLEEDVPEATRFEVDFSELEPSLGGSAARGPVALDEVAALGIEIRAPGQDDFELVIDSVRVVPACGNGRLDADESCDDGDRTSGDGCSAACRDESLWAFVGTAAGGRIVFSVEGVDFDVTTDPGQSAAEVARRVATTIASDPALAAANVGAIAVENLVAVEGAVGPTEVDDPGLAHRSAPECSNGRDDDGDGFRDHPDDPGCSGPGDPTEGVDGDGDLVSDAADNCVELANPQQRDSNRDGYGNRCDADYDGNGAVGISDFNVLRAQFGRTAEDAGFDPDVDADGNGAIGIADFSVLRAFFGAAPGPSGLGCAGTVPCPSP
ncbi:MAG: hypothetical protein QNK03_13295 [Myxococcota bacterium]|nr:hypothetical protein [Myxococcota bacterium]